MNLLLIVIAVSLDGFGVGVTYGMRKIKIPFRALSVIVICSGCIVISSMVLGHFLRSFISPDVTSKIGSIILILLGLFVLFSIIRQERPTKKRSTRKLGMLEHFKVVLANPKQADKDNSGIISTGEAIVLGTALALDAFGAGLGAAMLGYPPVLTASLIALMSGLFVFSGLKTGFFLSGNKVLSRLTFLPPVVLIGIGVMNFFG